MNRRTLLKTALGGSVLLLAGGSVQPRAAIRHSKAIISAAFQASNEADVLRLLFGDVRPRSSGQVNIAAPFLTSPGLPAIIRVESAARNARAIALTAEKAEHPLVAFVKLTGASCFFSTRIALAQTTLVSAYILTDSEVLYSARKIKVTEGGYGMHVN